MLDLAQTHLNLWAQSSAQMVVLEVMMNLEAALGAMTLKAALGVMTSQENLMPDLMILVALVEMTSS